MPAANMLYTVILKDEYILDIPAAIGIADYPPRSIPLKNKSRQRNITSAIKPAGR
jgi:hypothetical protein